MNKIQRIGVWTLISLLMLMLAMGVYHLYAQYQRTHFRCDAILIVRKGDADLSLALHYVFQGKKGFATMKGTLRQGEKVTNVSRKYYFASQNKGSLFHIESLLAMASPADNSNTEELARYLPRAYLQKQQKFDFVAYPAGKEGYVLSTGYVPSFYCVPY